MKISLKITSDNSSNTSCDWLSINFSMITKISGLPLVNAVANGKLLFAFCELWFEVAFTLFISLAMVNMKVFGFELAISDNELRAILHVSAIGDSGKLADNLKKTKIRN